MRDNLGKYTVGSRSDEPLDVKIKRMYSLEKSWRNRGDYIADIRDRHPYIYNSWRGIRFTEKGKKTGNAPEWDDFRTFYNDVSPSYKKGLLFRRLDLRKPHSKHNFIWVTQEESELLKSNLVWLEYNGRNLTLKQWASESNCRISAVRNRYYKRDKYNYSTQEIIYGRVKKRGSKKAKDISETKSIRAKASKMISSYKAKDKKNCTDICDITIEWMIDNVLTKDCHYCGDGYRVGCDRIDNSKGHTMSNILPCCFDCNCARGDNFTVEEMERIGKTIRLVKNGRIHKN